MTSSPARRRKARLLALLFGLPLVSAGLFALATGMFAEATSPTAQAPATTEAPGALPAPARPPERQDPAGTGAAAPTQAAHAPGAVDDPAETAAIQKYLDSIYTKEDVVSSFRTAVGEDIDCIDFYAQASVKSEIARGRQVRLPTLPSAASPPVSSDGVAFNGQPDENGNPRRCSGNTVPVLRKTVAMIKAGGGLAAYTRRAGRKDPPPSQNWQFTDGGVIDVPSYMHVQAGYLSDAGVGTIWGGVTTASLNAPALSPLAKVNDGHSLAQTWMTTGTEFAPCVNNEPTGQSCVSKYGSQCYQTVEVGWTVSNLFGNAFDANPRLFVFSTQDGYWSTGCYAGLGPCQTNACDFPSYPAEPCSNLSSGLVPDPFEAWPNAVFAPGQTLCIAPGGPNVSGVPKCSAGGQTPVEATFQTSMLDGDAWIVLVNGNPIGLYPLVTFDGGFYLCSGATCQGGTGSNCTGGHWTGGTCCTFDEQTHTSGPPCQANGTMPAGLTTTPGAPMNTSATSFTAGGEITPGYVQNDGTFTLEPLSLQNPPTLEMGSGLGAALGFGYAAYHRNVEVSAVMYPGAFVNPSNFSFEFATDMNCYSLGYGLNGLPQTISLTPQSLHYTFLQYEAGVPPSYLSPNPGVLGTAWGNYFYYGGLGYGQFLGDAGPYDFCCSSKAQNGYGTDNQCAASQSTQYCP
jgi:hypothetical protein